MHNVAQMLDSATTEAAMSAQMQPCHGMAHTSSTCHKQRGLLTASATRSSTEAQSRCSAQVQQRGRALGLSQRQMLGPVMVEVAGEQSATCHGALEYRWRSGFLVFARRRQLLA